MIDDNFRQRLLVNEARWNDSIIEPQNLKDTTTVLQQLEVCIKSLKNGLSVIDGYNDRLTALENKSLYQHTIYVNGLVQSGNGTVQFINAEPGLKIDIKISPCI